MIINIVIAMGLFALAIVILVFLKNLIKADSVELQKSLARVSSFGAVVKGKAHIKNDWLPDARVCGGLLYNKKKNRIEMSARISEDSLDRILGHDN